MELWETSASGLIRPAFPFLALALYTGPIFLVPTHYTDIHIPFPVAPKTGHLQFPPRSLCSCSFLSLPPHLPGKHWYTLQVFSPVFCLPLNPSLTMPSLLSVLTIRYWCPCYSVKTPSAPSCMYLHVCCPSMGCFRAGNWASLDCIMPAFGTHIYPEKIWK